MFILSQNIKTVYSVSCVLMRPKQFPLLTGSSPLKTLLISYQHYLAKIGSERNFQLGAFTSRHAWPFPGQSVGQLSYFGISLQRGRATRALPRSVAFCGVEGANKAPFPNKQRELNLAFTTLDPFV